MKFMKPAAVAALVLALSGCATTAGKDFDQSKIGGFVAHQTTMDQVIAQLGQPQERETESDGTTRLHYQYVVSKSSVNDYVPFAPVKADTDGKSTFLYFDRSGKYLRAESTQSNM